MARNKIEVLHRLSPNGEVIPQSFTWKNQTYPVHDAEGRRWAELDGEHMLVMSGNIVYELIFSPDKTSWYIKPRPNIPGVV